MPNFNNGHWPGVRTPAHKKVPATSTVTEAFQNYGQHDRFIPSAQTIGNRAKHFSTLRTAFAQRGHRLERTFHGEDRDPTYYSERWGLVRRLPTLHDAAMFLAQIGGRL